MSTNSTHACPAAAAEAIFQASPYLAIRFLNCQFHQGVLTITGVLPSFYLKQIAQKAVSGIDGVERIEDLVQVSV
jgi:hypothetical protein